MNKELATNLQLNERQAAFVAAYVEAYASQHDCSHAAACASGLDAAGYGRTSGQSSIDRVMRQPEVLAAIHIEVARRIHALAPAALATIDAVMTGKIKDGAKVRLDAAKVLLDRAGHIAPRAKALGEGGDKTLGEMSLDELKATQERLQSEILARAKVVNAQPDSPTADQPIDLIG